MLAREQTLLRDQAELIAALAAARSGNGRANPASFDECPPAMQRESLRQQLEALGVTATFDLVEFLRGSVETPIPIEARRRVARDKDGIVRLSPTPTRAPAFSAEERVVEIAGSGGPLSLVGRLRGPPAAPNQWPFTAGSSRPGRSGTRHRLRHWRPGDRAALADSPRREPRICL